MTEGTEHHRAYGALRQTIMIGDLTPGQAVTIHGAAGRIEAGITPIREAIRRLVAEGALTIGDNRRVCVPRLSSSQLADLSLARTRLEPELARRAVGVMDSARIDTLEAADMAGREALAGGDVAGFLQANHRFHFHIYEAAGSDILSQIVSTLWLRLGPAMRAVGGFFGDEDGALPLRGTDGDPHRHAIAALRARDPEALGRAIERDIARGTSLIARGIASGKV